MHKTLYDISRREGARQVPLLPISAGAHRTVLMLTVSLVAFVL